MFGGYLWDLGLISPIVLAQPAIRCCRTGVQDRYSQSAPSNFVSIIITFLVDNAAVIAIKFSRARIDSPWLTAALVDLALKPVTHTRQPFWRPAMLTRVYWMLNRPTHICLDHSVALRNIYRVGQKSDTSGTCIKLYERYHFFGPTGSAFNQRRCSHGRRNDVPRSMAISVLSGD